ncbi:hypothetical protein D3C76_806210 [compost metagenome]
MRLICRLRQPQNSAEIEISAASRRNATVGQALMPWNRNIGSPRPLSVKSRRTWYAHNNARINTTSGTRMYHPEASNKPAMPAAPRPGRKDTGVVRRISSAQIIPNRISTKVIHMNSTRQYRIPTSADRADAA